MSREAVLIFFGVLTGLTPFVGLPPSWLDFILPGFALIIAGTAYTLHREKQPKRVVLAPEEIIPA